MKKILSTLLVAAMLLSLVIVASVPVAAVDGQWTVYGPASQYAEDYDGDPRSVPGYEYTEDGLHMIPANWSTSSPWALIQTKEPVDLKDGVYMSVRIDDFTYTAGDRWFNINIWDSQMIEPPVAGFGEGVQTIIRTTDDGKVSLVNGWYTENFTDCGSSNMTEEKNLTTEDGKVILNLTVTWDGSTYAVDINGAAAPEKIITYMNEKYGENSEAYIGFCAQNSEKGGTIEATVLKFGTSEADATIPMGDDKMDPIDNSVTYAEIADPSTVPEGQPAIFMNANKADSDIKSTPKPSGNIILSVNDDYSIHAVFGTPAGDAGTWYVKNDVSYSIKDFPVVLYLTKNFCTCGVDECFALESSNLYIMSGDVIAPADKYRVIQVDMCYDPYVIGDDTYLYFYNDFSDEYASFEVDGRINGVRLDFGGVDINTPGANAFDLMFVAFFRTVDEAEAYVESYLTNLGWSEGEETTAPAETEPVETTPVETDPVETNPVETDPVETKPVETKPAETKPAETKPVEPEEPKKSGCGSVVGFGSIAVVAVAAACGMVAFKKKED